MAEKNHTYIIGLFIYSYNITIWNNSNYINYKYRVILSLEAPNKFGKVFQNLEKRIQVCLDVKGDQIQHRL